MRKDAESKAAAAALSASSAASPAAPSLSPTSLAAMFDAFLGEGGNDLDTSSSSHQSSSSSSSSLSTASPPGVVGQKGRRRTSIDSGAAATATITSTCSASRSISPSRGVMLYHATQEMHVLSDEDGEFAMSSSKVARTATAPAPAPATRSSAAARPATSSQQLMMVDGTNLDTDVRRKHIPESDLVPLLQSDERCERGDTFVSSSTSEALYASSEVLRDAVDAVLDQKTRSAFAVIRPPGHHCGARARLGEESLGFCLLSNAMMVARYAQWRHGVRVGVADALRAQSQQSGQSSSSSDASAANIAAPLPLRIAIVDIDTHAGNGTEEILLAVGQNQLQGLEQHSLYFSKEFMPESIAKRRAELEALQDSREQRISFRSTELTELQGLQLDYGDEPLPARGCYLDSEKRVVYAPPASIASASADDDEQDIPSGAARRQPYKEMEFNAKQVPHIDTSLAHRYARRLVETALGNAASAAPAAASAAPVMPQQLMYCSLHQYNMEMFPAEMDISGVEVGRTSARIFVPEGQASEALNRTVRSTMTKQRTASAARFDPSLFLPPDASGHFLAGVSVALPVVAAADLKRVNPGSAEWRALMESSVLPAVEAFKPDLIVCSAGFDAHRCDPVGQLNLEDADYEFCAQRLGDIVGRNPRGLGCIAVLEGGYGLPGTNGSARRNGDLTTAAVAFVRGLTRIEAPAQPEGDATAAELRSAAEAVVVRAAFDLALQEADLAEKARFEAAAKSLAQAAKADEHHSPMRNKERAAVNKPVSGGMHSSTQDSDGGLISLGEFISKHNASLIAAATDDEVEGDVSLGQILHEQRNSNRHKGASAASAPASASKRQPTQQYLRAPSLARSGNLNLTRVSDPNISLMDVSRSSRSSGRSGAVVDATAVSAGSRRTSSARGAMAAEASSEAPSAKRRRITFADAEDEDDNMLPADDEVDEITEFESAVTSRAPRRVQPPQPARSKAAAPPPPAPVPARGSTAVQNAIGLDEWISARTERSSSSAQPSHSKQQPLPLPPPVRPRSSVDNSKPSKRASAVLMVDASDSE
jgi:acetoin utilization deacetylase AcuC-like enzyme